MAVAKGKKTAKVAVPDRPDFPAAENIIRQRVPFERIYKPEFCEKVIELGELGASLTEMAASIGVRASAFNNWRKKYPEFEEAVEHAQMLSQTWWEKTGRSRVFNDDPFNATAYIFTMKNMFRETWADVRETRMTGHDGGAIKVEATTIDANALDAEQRDILRQVLLSTTGKPSDDSMDES